MTAWYNDIDPFACSVLRARIADGRLPAGTVAERSIKEIDPNEIPERTQVHLFAGIGGFAYAARLAGMPDDFDIWTGGFPCQDISCAGKGVGLHGSRSGMFFEIVRLLHGVQRRPDWLLLENVPALLSRGLDRVLDELAGAGYTCWPVVVGAWAVGAPHKRDRVWIVGRLDNATSPRCSGNPGCEPGGQIRNGTRGAEPTGRRGEGGEGLADAPRGGLGADRGARDAGHADEPCAFCGYGFDHELLGKYGCPNCEGEGLANASRPGCEECDVAPEPSDPEQREPMCSAPAWPSRPGQIQHDWESPRLSQFPVGGLVNGLPVRLVRRANKDALKAYGNSIVPQAAAVVMKAIKELTHVDL